MTIGEGQPMPRVKVGRLIDFVMLRRVPQKLCGDRRVLKNKPSSEQMGEYR